MIKGNKGEWSEFYAFLKIITDKRLFAADENLKKLADKFYTVLQVIREEAKNGEKIYDVTDNGFISISDGSGKQLATVSENKIAPKISKIFSKIKTSPDTTFSMKLAQEVMTDLRCTQIKAGNSQKSDLMVIIHDSISPTFPKLGFSVKSMLGAPSTLLNASGATNFIYKIENFKGKIELINSIEGRSKVRDRIQAIKNYGGSLVFDSVQSEAFKRNLRMIDTVLPDILAVLVESFYEGNGKDLPALVASINDNKILKAKHDLGLSDYEFKIKSFLMSVALGMTPNTEWDGFTKAHGGYIIVKEDGEIVCYHLYNRDEFQEYLYRNTRLETPSTTRHQFAELYEENKELFIKLNLQIRFIK